MILIFGVSAALGSDYNRGRAQTEVGGDEGNGLVTSILQKEQNTALGWQGRLGSCRWLRILGTCAASPLDASGYGEWQGDLCVPWS